MRAVRLHDAGDLRLENVDPPAAPPSGFVNVKVSAAGICGSDLHNYRTGQWITRRPSVAGHEFCGIVSAVAEDVETLTPGDMVVADSRVWCGACPACVSGRANICESLGFVGEVCDGGFADEVQLPARLLHRYDASLPAKVAAMAEPLAVALHAVRKLNVRAGEPVLIAGCGTIGGLSALILSKLHDGPILVADLNEARATGVAGLVGARHVSLSREAISAALGDTRLRYAVDATGSIKAIAALIDLLHGGGAIALVGISHGTFALDPNILVEREIALVGCHAFNDELPEAIAMLNDLHGPLEQISETIGLDDVPEAYERLLSGQNRALKTIVSVS
jgi:(R,R)-butanediol dehydrogenase/meso-butanediol dehydrogenase/diacetyl reductase